MGEPNSGGSPQDGHYFVRGGDHLMAETARLTFTKTKLAELPVPDKGRKYYYDDRTPGFAFCVTDKGKRNFYYCAKVRGRSVRTKIGPFPGLTVEQARDIADKKTGGVAEGVDPRRPSHALEPTVKDLFEHWLSFAKLRKKTWRDDERIFNKYLAKLRNRRLSELTTAEVANWHRTVGEKHGPYQANRARAVLSAIWSKAEELGHNGRNPCEGVKRFREQERERFLQQGEMRPFFEALAEEPPIWRDFWLLCLFSGARRGNVASMAWKDLDLKAAAWYLPGQKTKSGLPVVVVLPPPAVAILEARRDEQPEAEEWVFPAKTRTGHIVDPRKSWARVLKKSGIEDLRPHDLRRSLGSWQAIAGASLQIVGASLGHRDPKATAVYARLQLAPVRTSVNGVVDSMIAAGGEEVKKALPLGESADGEQENALDV